MENKFYVYALLDTRFCHYDDEFDYKPFYIGKGSGDRCTSHFKQVIFKNKHPNILVFNKIKKIIKETNNYPSIQIIEKDLFENDAFNLEKYYIKKLGRLDLNTGILLNFTNGGDGVSGRVISDSQREQRRLHKINWYLNMDDNYKKTFYNNLSTSLSNYYNNKMTEYDMVIRKDSIKNGLSNRPEEEKQRQYKNISEGNLKYWQNLSEEEQLIYSEKRRVGYQNIPDDIKKEINIKKGNASKLAHENRSEEEKIRLKQVWSDKRKEYWNKRKKRFQTPFGVYDNIDSFCSEFDIKKIYEKDLDKKFNNKNNKLYNRLILEGLDVTKTKRELGFYFLNNDE